MKDILKLQSIVNSLEDWVRIMATLATCPRPYTAMDKYMICTADRKIERAFELLRKEVTEGSEMATAYQQRALRLRDPKMHQEALASCFILNGIVNQTNFYINKFNTYLALCESHV